MIEFPQKQCMSTLVNTLFQVFGAFDTIKLFTRLSAHPLPQTWPCTSTFLKTWRRTRSLYMPEIRFVRKLHISPCYMFSHCMLLKFFWNSKTAHGWFQSFRGLPSLRTIHAIQVFLCKIKNEKSLSCLLHGTNHIFRIQMAPTQRDMIILNRCNNLVLYSNQLLAHTITDNQF